MELKENNYAEEKLNGKHKIKVTFNNNLFYLEIQNGASTILKKESNKDILQSSSIKNDLITFIVDTRIVDNRKEAREFRQP